MEKIPTTIRGVWILNPKELTDNRGLFLKVFHKETFENFGMETDFKESYYSISKKNVIRGMHFQKPPTAHAKLVYVTSGRILDVVLDIRKGSPTYGKYVTAELSEDNHKVMYVPIGCAHGFLSLKNSSCVIYLQTTTYSKADDAGIHFNSFGVSWGIKKPITSDRDTSHPNLKDFISPFKY